MTTSPFERGPYLLAALLCEKVLEEKSGMKSAIRIIDRVTHNVVAPNPPANMEPFDYEIALLIRLKSGITARGPYTLQIRLIKPSQESPPPLEQVVYFEGEEDRGIDVVANLRLKLDMTGIYWFHILLNGVQLTRVPLRVIYMPQVMRIGGPGESPPQVQGPPLTA